MNNWYSRIGAYEQKNNVLTFKGKMDKYVDPQTTEEKQAPSFGIALYNQPFSNGTISAEVAFKKTDVFICEILFNYSLIGDIENYILLGIKYDNDDSHPAFAYASFDGKKYDFISIFGSSSNLKDGEKVKLKVIITGTKIVFYVNEIQAYSGSIPLPLISSQVGVLCQSSEEIHIYDFKLETEKPKAFVIMKYEKDYDELFLDVIEPTCKDKFDVIRADKSYLTGIIIIDIVNQIKEASLVIADVTPDSPNVFYEVGFSHALNKPTILLADKNKRENLPFDIHGFRVIFYENTIGGKNEIVQKLKYFMENINTAS